MDGGGSWGRYEGQKGCVVEWVKIFEGPETEVSTVVVEVRHCYRQNNLCYKT